MANNIKERLHWVVHFPQQPEPDSDRERWVKCAKNVQSERESIGISSSQPEKPEVVRCVRGFVAWKHSGSALQATAGAGLPGMTRMSRPSVFS